MDRYWITDGLKTTNLTLSDDPRVWTFLSNPPKSDHDILYSRVAAAFRAYNLKANTVGNMPFVLLKGEEEFDTSFDWQNKVGFLPNPGELFRLDTLSYMASNTIYNLRTTDAVGYKTRGLYHAVASTFSPIVHPVTGELLGIERAVGTSAEKYKPKDPRLVRMWRLDQTTEVLPSPHTEAAAIMNAAGEVYYADMWIKHFFEGGGVPPTVIGMKGAVSPDKRDDEEKKWTDWLLGLGRWRSKKARVFNADTLDVKQFGSSITDLKNNEVYQSAIANIAIGTGIPLSLLMANSANYATAKEEKSTWYENDIIPFLNWLAFEYNEQVFHPINLHLEFRPETLDPQQEDETERAQAISMFADFLAKCPTYDIFIGTCETFGYELAESLITAAEKYYKDKEEKQEELDEQMAQAGVVPGSGPVIELRKDEEDEDEEEEKKPPRKFVPSMDQLREMELWQSVAFRKMKRGESMTVPWENKTMPEDVYKSIAGKLATASTEAEIKAAFDLDILPAETRADDSDLRALAAAMNKLADAQQVKAVPMASSPLEIKADNMTVNNNMDVERIVKAVTEIQPPQVVVNVPQQPAPVVNVSVPAQEPPIVNVNVPEPVVNVNVKPTPVTVQVPAPPVQKEIAIERDREGKITGARVTKG